MAEPPPIGTSTHTYLHPEVPINITLLSKLSTHHKVIRASVSLFYLEHHFTFAFILHPQVRVYRNLI